MAKQPLTENQKIIHSDILRYKKNKLPATFALLGLVFNCLYFMLIYGIYNSFFYKIDIGLSVLITLISLLAMFLSSEGIKGYSKKYAILLIVLAVVQVVRIFFLPLQGLRHDALWNENVFNSAVRYFGVDLSQGVLFAILVVYLVASAAFLVASAVLGYINCVRLENISKKIEKGEVDIMEVVKAMDAEDEAKAKEASEAEVKVAETEVQPTEEEVQ